MVGRSADSITTAEILGEQFGGDLELRALLEAQEGKPRSVNYAAIALAIGWPDSPLLDRLLAERRPGQWFLLSLGG